MGIVQKQSITGSVVVYAGAVLGFITSGLLFPNFLRPEQIGLLSLLVTYSVLFAQLASGGFLHTISRMFPYFRNYEQKHNGFLYIIIIVTTIGAILISATFLIAEPLIVSNSAQENTLFTEYAYLIVPLFISIVFFNAFDAYTRALYNATRGILQRELILRVIILGIFGLYWAQYISFHHFVHLYIAAYGYIMLYMTIRLISDKQFHLCKPNKKILTQKMRKELTNVSMYGFFISAASFLILNIDRIMIEKIIIENPLAQVGIYTTCTYFATMIILPARPLIKISTPIIADAWKAKNLGKIQELYSKTTINQAIIGTLVFVGIIVNLDSIFRILPQEYSQGLWVMIFIGLYYLTEMFAGTNNAIIANSPHYKILSVSIFIFIGLIIILNVIFIPRYGISGAAFASFIAKFIYQCFTFLFVNKKYKLQPYSKKHIIVILIGAITIACCFFIPPISSLILSILIRSVTAIIIFSGLTILFSVSEDVIKIYKSFLQKIK